MTAVGRIASATRLAVARILRAADVGNVLAAGGGLVAPVERRVGAAHVRYPVAAAARVATAARKVVVVGAGIEYVDRVVAVVVVPAAADAVVVRVVRAVDVGDGHAAGVAAAAAAVARVAAAARLVVVV